MWRVQVLQPAPNNRKMIMFIPDFMFDMFWFLMNALVYIGIFSASSTGAFVIGNRVAGNASTKALERKVDQILAQPPRVFDELGSTHQQALIYNEMRERREALAYARSELQALEVSEAKKSQETLDHVSCIMIEIEKRKLQGPIEEAVIVTEKAPVLKMVPRRR